LVSGFDILLVRPRNPNPELPLRGGLREEEKGQRLNDPFTGVLPFSQEAGQVVVFLPLHR
jgi:hypothetical protein